MLTLRQFRKDTIAHWEVPASSIRMFQSISNLIIKFNR